MKPPHVIGFGGTKILGIVTRFVPPPFELHPYETHFAGVKGNSRIEGGTGKRVLEIEILIFNNYRDRNAIHTFIKDTLNWNLVERNDTMNYSTADPRFSVDYPDCTFEGFTPTTGELPDVAGTLDGFWFCEGILRFVQSSHDG